MLKNQYILSVKTGIYNIIDAHKAIVETRADLEKMKKEIAEFIEKNKKETVKV